ncbi:Crp/Fnr family transcriptional regulator [Vandammella animalimorsus]|uniref:Crp/Fnr family transcriptional regulator n=1 Tax=Vandammella animalimorsus TaxID=2029117 RepID=A0A2A2AKI0_9BURK|nr:Crp/Fnr family transcriptional regulator [Vandammella animalimorsus]PAT39085.1 Crp/Fnr family transcriptional regulator [Vandammella animalimorsus]
MRSPAPERRLPAVVQQRRAPTEDELAAIPWLERLKPQDRRFAEKAIEVGQIPQGDYICIAGKPVRYWLGVVDGLFKMSNHRIDGTTISYAGIPKSCWFGEGTALKRESYRYNIQALRKSTIAALPLEAFHTLLDRSIEFNRVIMGQLNERVGQFIAGREMDRLSNPDARVARSLAALVNPVLAPNADRSLRITQQELAYLIGLSRQRVNMALVRLQAQGLVQLEYGGLQVLEPATLAQYE